MSGGGGQGGTSNLPTGPLNDQELQSLRRIIRDDDRARFLWATLRIWGTWIGAVVAALYASWDVLARMVRAGLGIGGH